MRKWVVICILLLVGCYASTEEVELREDTHQVAGEATASFEEIERLLVSLELEVGLGNLGEATSYFNELRDLIETYDMTPGQEARYHTFTGLLLEMQAGTHNVRIFSGSDAVALVMNVHGTAPEGYQFVYHEIPSFVGSDGLGYYVFLVSDAEGIDSIVTTFFVTDRGRVTILE